MDVALLELLRCPFCGTRLDLVDNDALTRHGSQVAWAVLGCQCCAFPVIDGIPVLIADDATRAAMHAMEAGRRDEALTAMLGLDAAGAERLQTLLRNESATYREALDIISPDAEGTYFVYRFSDPTFVLAETLVRVLGRGAARSTRVIDLCGGSGHLSRVLGEVSGRPVVVADLYFSKLWLARRFTAPGSVAVCCDANHPLPFHDQAFSMVVLSDAFPYIWHKRLLAGEMMRLAAAGGAIVMPHLHSALGFNFSAGMTLTPAAYRDLFAPRHPRLFRDSDLLDDILGHTAIDLSRDVSPIQAGDTPSITLIASDDPAVFAAHPLPGKAALAGTLCVNPLYRVEQLGATARLTLTFPTPEYEEEFGGVRRYLPDSLTLDADLSGPLRPEQFGSAYADLRRRRVLLDTPPHYC
jgi:uncharacterized protein YbaR (Trm112 family)/SAM-dependent methyltransferase